MISDSKAFEILIRPLIHVHQLVERAINTSSGNEGDVITLTRYIVEDENLILSAQIIGLIGLFKYEQNYIVLWKKNYRICAV